MRLLAAIALLVVVVSAPTAPVPETPPIVQGPLPTFVNLSQAKIDAKTIQGTRVEYQTVTKTLPVVVDMGGVKVTRNQTVTEMVQVTRSFSYALEQFDVVTAEGKTLSIETALPLLKAAPLILVSEGPLDPAFQKVLAKDALVLVRKRLPPPKP